MLWKRKTKAQGRTATSEAWVSSDPKLDQQRRLDTIWRNTALGREEFDATYGTFLTESLRYLDALPQEASHDDLLAQVNTALRVRQAHILPRGIASEDASRLSEVMSFAIAVVVVLEYVQRYVGVVRYETQGHVWCPLLDPMPSRAEPVGPQPMDPAFVLLLLPKLVTEEGLSWLYQEYEALNEILCYFKGVERSAFAEIVHAARVGDRNAVANPGTLGSLPERSIESPLTPPESLQGVERSDQAVKPEDAPKAPNRTSEALTGARQEQPQRTAKGYRYLLWLRQQLDEGTMVANEADSTVHLVAGGQVFLRIPEAFEAYAKVQGVAPKQIQNQLVRLNQHRIKKSGKDIFVGQYANGRRCPGLVLKEADVLWPKQVPGISAAVIAVR